MRDGEYMKGYTKNACEKKSEEIVENNNIYNPCPNDLNQRAELDLHLEWDDIFYSHLFGTHIALRLNSLYLNLPCVVADSITSSSTSLACFLSSLNQ